MAGSVTALGTVDGVDIGSDDPDGAVRSDDARERDRVAGAGRGARSGERRGVVVNVDDLEGDLSLGETAR